MSNSKPIRSAVGSSDPTNHAQDQENARRIAGASFPATALVYRYFDQKGAVTPLLSEIDRQVEVVQSGDLRGLEAMLVAQSIALNAMFSDFGVRAKKASTTAEVQALAQLALKAQSGTRATILALAELKAPRQVAFVQQTNIATNQQINTHAPARKTSVKKAPIKLKALEANDGSKTVDIGAAARAGRADPRDATLAPLDRAQDARRQGPRGRQRQAPGVKG